jgi:molybdenum cofactor biosynthesis enzyme MoaA
MEKMIFNKPILIKEYGCAEKGVSPRPIIPFVNLFVKVTDACNAHCSFCSNQRRAERTTAFNTDKLWDIVRRLKDNDVFVNRINITGGEPATCPRLVEKILAAASEEDFRQIHIHLNTNGLLPDSQQLMKHPRWDSISISLHHYDRAKLSAIYGCKIPEESLCFKDINLDIVNASCNLIRGYIDSATEVEKMMKYAISLGLPRLGFVSLMKVNTYCEEHYVDFSEIDFTSIPHLHFTEQRSRGTDCKCSNYLFNHDAKILEIYMRNYCNFHYCESSLLYDGAYLRQGFHDDNIIY